MSGDNPYTGLNERAYWRTAVAARSPFDISQLWTPKFLIDPADAVCTYGSCFAQHIGKALKARGFSWHIAESTPAGCPNSVGITFGYGIFSARTGNIYTTSLLRQWLSWATGDVSVPLEVWQDKDRYVDPFRPAIEPRGFAAVDELRASRQFAIDCFAKSIADSKYLVFTLGLTESWFNRDAQFEYAVCPGTVAGLFDASQHVFVNQDYGMVLDGLNAALALVRRINPQIRVILTVSPVPLTATASGAHVLVATMHSKSILRAVAGQMAASHDWIDYFPSYEIINSPSFCGMFFEPNKRSVNPAGVAFVMDAFFEGMPGGTEKRVAARKPRSDRPARDVNSAGDVCEEALLDAFGPAT